MRDIVLDGLLLPLRLYLQPRAFRQQVAALAPDLSDDYGLFQVLLKLGDLDFCCGLEQLLLRSAAALLGWLLFVILAWGLFYRPGYDVDWFLLALGVAGAGWRSACWAG